MHAGLVGIVLLWLPIPDPTAYLLFGSAGKIPRLTEAEAEALMAYTKPVSHSFNVSCAKTVLS